MDYLPDGVVIADKNRINYINAEAWSILRCKSNDDVSNISNVFCLDTSDCSLVTPEQQLARYLQAVDDRFALVDKTKLLEHIYNTV